MVVSTKGSWFLDWFLVPLTYSPVYVASQAKNCTIVRRLRVQVLTSQGTYVALKVVFRMRTKHRKPRLPHLHFYGQQETRKGHSLLAKIRTRSYDFSIRVSGATL